MLIQLRCSENAIRTIHIFYIRNWLANACFIYEPFKKCKFLMLKLIEEKVYELGQMVGSGGINLNKSDIETSRDAFWAALLSGKTLMLNRQIYI